MIPKKEEIEKRKKDLQKQLDNLVVKINQGKQAITNMEATSNSFQGAIQQCDWTLEMYNGENKK